MNILRKIFFLFIGLLLLGSCVTPEKKIVFQPTDEPEPLEFLEHWDIIESQAGGADAEIPEWLSLYLSGGISSLESLDAYANKYVFVGENRGKNFRALRQWATGFRVEQDFSRLVAARIEKRMIQAASLYPDDEYGNYFEMLIKKAFDREYSGAQQEESFWIKCAVQEQVVDEEQGEGDDFLVQERYDFFILISVDKQRLQNNVRELLQTIKPSIPPTREQNIAINRIKQIFFDGF